MAGNPLKTAGIISVLALRVKLGFLTRHAEDEYDSAVMLLDENSLFSRDSPVWRNVMPDLRYGSGSVLKVDLKPETFLGKFDSPQAVCLGDPAAAMAAAAADPLDFPPLVKAMVPGDCVVIALDQGIPRLAAIVDALIETVIEAGVQPRDITLLFTHQAAESADRLPGELKARFASQVHFHVHDPADRAQLGYLAASEQGRAIYMNRLLIDADLVLPVGCVRASGTTGYNGINGCLFPAFSDCATQDHFRRRWLTHRNGSTSRNAAREADEVGWLLGTIFTVQIIPGGDGQVLQVLAGDIEHVAQRAQRICHAAWKLAATERADLVVASVDKLVGSESWFAIGRALATATQLVSDQGAIALCTDLHVAPGPSIKELGQTDDPARAMQRIRSRCDVDALPAVQLAQALNQARVYLVSQLDETTVEDLGMVHVDDPADLSRLAKGRESCLLVGNAQHVIPVVD